MSPASIVPVSAIAPISAIAPPRRIALVHEWLAGYAGSEKVVEQILAIYPEAELFCVVDFTPEAERGFVQGKKSTTTFIQRLPRARKSFRAYLPLMPLAIEQLDLAAFDLVISSSHAVAKGAMTGPDQLHVSYVHSPMRYAWDLQNQYLRESGLARGIKSWLTRAMLHYLRNWDVRSANGVDVFVTNSEFVKRRVQKFYRRDADVIYPPVDVHRFAVSHAPRDDFYLTASRLVPYKKVQAIAEAFASMPDKRLVIIGDGPEYAAIQRSATPNVTLLGYQSNEVMIDHMQRAKAFIFAAEEDFGIVPVEAQACGTPVLALARGGSLETVRHSGDVALRTGLLFTEQTAASIADAVQRFESGGVAYSSQACRRHAETFAPEVFRTRFAAAVTQAWEAAARRHVHAPEAQPVAADVVQEPVVQEPVVQAHVVQAHAGQAHVVQAHVQAHPAERQAPAMAVPAAVAPVAVAIIGATSGATSAVTAATATAKTKTTATA